MHIEIIPASSTVDPDSIRDSVCVVIDVFRASSTLLCLLEKGAQEVRVVGTVEEALALVSKGYLAVGERGEKPLEHFDLDNSPHGVMERGWQGRKVAFTTTNGTRGLISLRQAYQAIMAGFRNIDAAAGYLASSGRPVAIFPMGHMGESRYEDDQCAEALRSRILGNRVDWAQRISQIRASAQRSIQFRGGHYAKDVELSLEVNATRIIPIMTDSMVFRPGQ